MNTWRQFEDTCFIFLEEKYKDCDFTALGKSDSTKPDIQARTHGSTFNIEVKKPSSQSGQFVLLPDSKTEKFTFSPRNKTEENDFTDLIINYMNEDFQRYNRAGTAGQELDMGVEIFSDWIKNYYKSKGVKFFITKEDSYIIFPVEKLDRYFDISAKFRVKRSGSSIPSVKYQPGIIDMLKRNYGISDVQVDDTRLFVAGPPTLSRSRFIQGNYEYYLSPKSKTLFEVRQLSNTYNMNVIFTVLLKAAQDPADLRLFEDQIFPPE